MRSASTIALFLSLAVCYEIHSAAKEEPARIIDSSFLTHSPWPAFNGSYTSAVQSALMLHGLLILPRDIYEKLWTIDVQNECGNGVLYCRRKVDIDSLVSVYFHGPTTRELTSLLGLAKKYNYDRPVPLQHDPGVVLHNPRVLDELRMRGDPSMRNDPRVRDALERLD